MQIMPETARDSSRGGRLGRRAADPGDQSRSRRSATSPASAARARDRRRPDPRARQLQRRACGVSRAGVPRDRATTATRCCSSRRSRSTRRAPSCPRVLTYTWLYAARLRPAGASAGRTRRRALAASIVRRRERAFLGDSRRGMARIDETRPFLPVNIAVLTVSDTRSAADDTSGDTLVARHRRPRGTASARRASSCATRPDAIAAHAARLDRRPERSTW